MVLPSPNKEETTRLPSDTVQNNNHTLHAFPLTHSAEQQSYPTQKRLHVFPLTHSAER